MIEYRLTCHEQTEAGMRQYCLSALHSSLLLIANWITYQLDFIAKAPGGLRSSPNGIVGKCLQRYLMFYNAQIMWKKFVIVIMQLCWLAIHGSRAHRPSRGNRCQSNDGSNAWHKARTSGKGENDFSLTDTFPSQLLMLANCNSCEHWICQNLYRELYLKCK